MMLIGKGSVHSVIVDLLVRCGFSPCSNQLIDAFPLFLPPEIDISSGDWNTGLNENSLQVWRKDPQQHVNGTFCFILSELALP